jgi:Fe-S-cluster containining protein
MLPVLEFKRFPSECGSTCDACPKVAEENFHPDVRCCSYHPRIPNVLLGFALEDPATAPLIEKVIAEGLTIPDGLQSTPMELRLSLRQAVTPRGSGVTDVVCRFLDVENRKCGIYDYRNSVCATFFCNFDRPDGETFWKSLETLAGQCEGALSQWAIAKMGLDIDAYISRFDSLAAEMPRLESLPTASWPADVLKLLWGAWYGREADFFRGCAAAFRDERHSIAEILDTWTIRIPRKYDHAFLDSLPEELRREAVPDGVLSGEPALITDLRYQFELAHRNHWQQPEPSDG